VKKIVDRVLAHPRLWDHTAIFVTFGEGGGYYDSGYVQPLDFFGDGSRIPMIAVSPYSQGGHISHTYADHVSTLKFIEHNWGLGPISSRSRDNLPNPVARRNPYLADNSPAIGDLFDLFDFRKTPIDESLRRAPAARAGACSPPRWRQAGRGWFRRGAAGGSAGNAPRRSWPPRPSRPPCDRSS